MEPFFFLSHLTKKDIKRTSFILASDATASDAMGELISTWPVTDFTNEDIVYTSYLKLSG